MMMTILNHDELLARAAEGNRPCSLKGRQLISEKESGGRKKSLTSEPLSLDHVNENLSIGSHQIPDDTKEWILNQGSFTCFYYCFSSLCGSWALFLAYFQAFVISKKIQKLRCRR